MKCRFLQLAVFLLLGTATTVAVAWGCALWIDVEAVPGPKEFCVPNEGGCWYAGVQHRTGAIRIVADDRFTPERLRALIGIRPDASGSDEEFQRVLQSAAYYDRTIPAWSVLRGMRFCDAEPWSSWHEIQDARGWPLPAMQSRISAATINLRQGVQKLTWGAKVIDPTHYEVRNRIYTLPAGDGVMHGWALPIKANGHIGAIPFQPIWTNFALDSVIYAAAWFLTVLVLRGILITLSELGPAARIAMLMLAAILGPVTTLLVAWGCSAWLVGWQAYLIPDRTISGAIHEPAIGGWWRSELNYRRGALRVSSWNDLHGNNDGLKPADFIPTWAGDLRLSDEAEASRQRLRIADARGWPMLAMHSRFDVPSGQLLNNSEGGTVEQVQDGIVLPPAATSVVARGSIVRVLPLGVLWLGFVVDSAFYAAAWLSLICLPLAPWHARRVRRRTAGQCERCGYDLRGLLASRKCPECGKPLKPKSTGVIA
jgi:hypothetical protein